MFLRGQGRIPPTLCHQDPISPCILSWTTSKLSPTTNLSLKNLLGFCRTCLHWCTWRYETSASNRAGQCFDRTCRTSEKDGYFRVLGYWGKWRNLFHHNKLYFENIAQTSPCLNEHLNVGALQCCAEWTFTNPFTGSPTPSEKMFALCSPCSGCHTIHTFLHLFQFLFLVYHLC